jgi:hypothetical protein
VFVTVEVSSVANRPRDYERAVVVDATSKQDHFPE